MAKDYYKILGVGREASSEELKQAYRKLAHQHHPDKPGGDEAKFKEINEAYQVLGNVERRKQYDQFGTTFEDGGGGFAWQDFAKSGSGHGGPEMNFDFGDIGDIFSEFFGGGGGKRTSRRTTPKRGNDIEVELQVDFLEAVFGGEKPLELYKTDICQHCLGNGAEPGSVMKSCETCRGIGQVETTQRTILGSIRTVTACPTCQGEGKIPEKKCRDCHGLGYVKGKKLIKMHIPAGSDEGDAVKIIGEGEAGHRGGPSGDLYVVIRVRPHPHFKREGLNVSSTIEISFPQAALGAKVDVETLDGPVRLKIPDGTQSGKVFVLRAKGIQRIHGFGRGDHFVAVKVNTPTRLNRRQRQLLEEFEE